ncbi:efflux RND transporter permease subunit [Oceanicoccus sp. KOV_DT_Chl]|uniref:efflux RND transporter permease subunit n=1 Tax=Oceanicoccus sp. KOV_DT_Chl TaxID=1904639 RepID=UPI000C7AA5BB|nr:efflux RND transporter permease subunit [Oceanicoccus sp. KOV_DT_Chl]
MNKSGLIEVFVRHRNAANLLMILMILLGLYGVSSLNRQVMPTFGLDIITLAVQWPGASPEDVESNIIQAMEPELRFLDGVKKVQAVAYEGQATITVEYVEDTSMSKALTDIQAAVARLTTLPSEIEKPIITQVTPRDNVVSLEVSGPYSEQALKFIAQKMRDDLLDRGIEHIEIDGARDRELWVQISDYTLRSLDLSIQQVADIIGQSSIDLPSGSIETGGVSKQVRSNGLARNSTELGEIEIKALNTGEKIRLKDIAIIEEALEKNRPSHRLGLNPSVTLRIKRATNEDSIYANQKVQDYLKEITPGLPSSLTIKQYDVFALLVVERIGMLLSNGFTGLLLVIGILYIFLSGRLAFWVAAGIPISLMATLGIMSLMGLSLNLISMFALIMGLGIIVDDAIVVGEQVARLYSQGMSRTDAVLKGTKMMFAPVMAASLTTIMAFFPILMIGSAIGQIQSELPKTMIAIIIASLVECFLILPAHLLHSLRDTDQSQNRSWRIKFNQRFDHFRDTYFLSFVKFCYRERYAALMLALGVFVLSGAMMATGRVGFEFFPNVENNTTFANFGFSPGSSREKTIDMLAELERAARQAESELTAGKGGLISIAVSTIGQVEGRQDALRVTGDNLGGLTIELVGGEKRKVRTPQFINAWQQAIKPLPGLERLTITERKDGGPPGKAIDIRLFGADLKTLKAAATEARLQLEKLPGVLALEDNLPWGKEEIIIELTPQGRAMGFTTQSVAGQIRNAYEGAIAKRFSQDQEEIIVRVKHPEHSKDSVNLRDLYLVPAEGLSRVPLSEVVSFNQTVGFSQILREDGLRQVSVEGEIDPHVTTPGAVLKAFGATIEPDIRKKYGVQFALKGKADEQQEAAAGVKVGGLLAFASIYIILAWVLTSYSRPLVVMSIIPFGLIGAILGHWVMGFNMSMFSIIGLLGLAGIVVNDSIIVVTTVKQKEEEGADLYQAIIESTRERLRPVILTTLTTIGGLLPILAETSKQALLIQPLAITMVFGLLVSTTLVLGFVPALLGIIEDIKGKKTADADNVNSEPISV